jgi:hypothetical protein
MPTSLYISEIKYAVRGAAGWDTPETLLVNSDCVSPDLIFDSGGSAHVVIGCDRDTYHLYQGVSGWETEGYTDYNIDLISKVALALDESGYPLVFMSAYPAESTPEDIVIVWKNSEGWQRRYLRPGSLVDSSPLQRDPSGSLRLLITTDLYQPNNPENIYQILEFNDSVLTGTTTIREFPEAGETAFGLGPDGSPYILFYDRYREDLRLAYLLRPYFLPLLAERPTGS